ncbi:MAG: hypothetical protein DMG70_19100 [Acidobacteria bacterium]|nr:MAG: hypothetical protein DMG70_19100 [Acidobacteriota bacterium]PYY10187.1 MAG: hypothetical protein DMG69_08045 [Acidobacteriota bacterium]
MDSPELRTVAKRVVWFKPPEETLKDPKLFLAHLMTYGTLRDIVIALKYYSEQDFEQVLANPPSGVFDIHSWNYWNLRYHREPVPPLPLRILPAEEDGQRIPH